MSSVQRCMTLLAAFAGSCIAISEGRIRSVDEPAATYLEEWRGTPKEKITIRHLLQQNAGLELRFDASRSDGIYSRDARAYWGSYSKDVIVREYPPIHAPGAQFDYNYIVPELLGSTLERATGQRYADYLSARLWPPLGNHDAHVWLNRPGGEAHQDTALFSGPRDWLHFDVLLLDEGRFDGWQLVPASWVRRMREPFAADDVYYIDGYGGQRVYVVPSKQLVVMRVGAIAQSDWDDSRLVNTIIGGLLQVARR